MNVRTHALPLLLSSLSLLTSAAADEATIYRSTSPDGTVEFSDRAAPDATLVRPNPLVVIPADAPAPRSGGGSTPSPVATGPAPPPEGPDGQIERVEIASPPPEAVLLDPEGPLIVEIGTAPGSLSASGLRAEILLDGETVAAGHTSSLAVPLPERGTHELRVRLLTIEGRVHARSRSQALHVRRTLARGVLGTLHPTVADRTEKER